MKKTFFICLLLSGLSSAYAKHITGGEVIYDFISATATTKTYRITLQLFRDENCFNCAPMPGTAVIGIYNLDNNQLLGGFQSVSIDGSELLPTYPLPPCIVNPPALSYRVGYYTLTVQLPNNNNGYSATYQTCCRIDGIMNIDNNIGATYTCRIPGSNTLGVSNNDNSPRFAKGISVVCFGKPFTLDFSATDPDGDQLTYSLCNGYNGQAAQDAYYATPGPPPYSPLLYTNGYSGASPLGPGASINSQTGIISGIAPQAGKYVVSVCVNSYRNGLFIGTHRKDFIISVNPCDFAGAELLPEYITCDGFSYTFANQNQSPLNLTFYWDFGDPASGASNISTSPNPTHIYSDTGIFILKFVVNRGDPCADSTTSRVKVFPGYFPALSNTSPRCKNTPVQFRDLTTATYGAASIWSWNFGDPTSIGDTSHIKNPVYTYSQSGIYIAKLIVESNKGCIATIYDTVTIVDKPPLTVTNDTLICSVDNLQLNAASNLGGTVTWSPNYNINNINSFTPIVSPDVTTTYSVSYSDNFGCSATDSVVVSVVDTVTLKTGADTTICRTDGIVLSLNSNALKYVWTEIPPGGNTLNNALIKNPIATPTAAFTAYYVKGNIGSCVDFDSIKVKTVPYPLARAGNDTTICFGTSAFLHASGGSSYVWTPAAFLDNPQIAAPISVFPVVDVNYIVTVRDTLGCPKPVNDTVLVDVVRIIAEAGPRDTSIVIEQPLQLIATGGVFYTWTTLNEPSWLSNPNIYNPISLPLDNIEYIVKVTNGLGCFDTDTIYVKLFKVTPDLYVPTGFSPNGDGTNDILKPLALGLKSVDAFRIYNRWGQLLFSTNQIGAGWDGKFAGSEQGPGTYVWLAEGTDYRNRKLKRKGSVILIR